MTDCKNLELAREWAEWVKDNPDVYGGTSDRARAAADLIPSLPDQWIGADKLREVVADHHIDMSEELMEALGALLPAPTPPTLADMTPEERAECQWMQAEVDGRAYEGRAVITDIVEAEGKAKTILPSGQQFSFHISIVTPLPELPRLEWPGNEPGNVQVNRMDGLARTGETSPAETSDNRRSSTARTHPESAAPESASPRPEDVSVGEAWLIDIDGERTVALLGKVDPADDEPTWFADDGCGYSFDSGNPVARLVPETTEQDDEPVFDPAYTYLDRDGDEWEYIDGRWITGDTHAERVAVGRARPGFASLLAEYGPYTRIEKENRHDQ